MLRQYRGGALIAMGVHFDSANHHKRCRLARIALGAKTVA
jgi:hypothetical protein